MVSRCTIGLSSLVLVSAAFLVAAVTPQDKTGKDKTAPAMSGDEQVMMQKWQEFATPGPAHKVLDARVGKWTYKGRFWMEPGGTPEESPGTAESKWVMGGRYLQDETKGSMMGQPFEGLSFAGYDNIKKKYFWTWIDNMGTGLATAEGTYDASKKAFSYTTEMPDAMEGKYVAARSVETITGPDSWTMEMFSRDKDGKEFKCMEFVYTRVK